MAYQNISAELKDNEKQEILDLIHQIESKLPFLINLTSDERHSLPKMGDKTVAFVDKAIELAQRNPALVPPYVNLDELARDFELANKLRDIVNAITVLYEKISDTYLAVGSEAYVAALAFYNSAKAAAKLNVPGTDVIVNELGKRFVKKTNSQEKPQSQQ